MTLVPFLGSSRARVLCGAAVTLALLAWALRGMSPIIVWNAMREAHLAWLGLGLIAFLTSFSMRAWRWGTLLGAHRDPGGLGIRRTAIFIGFAGNCVLPARAGELIRARVLHCFGGVPFGTALGSIVAERLLDTIAVLLFLLAPLLPGAVTEASRTGVSALQLGWAGAVLVGACSAVLLAARWPDPVVRWAGGVSRMIRLGPFTPHVVASVSGLLSGLDALRSPRRTTTAIVETLCIWILIGITYWAGMIAFGITSPGLTGALFVGSVAALGIAIPSTPGYFGPFEASVRLALEVYGIPANTIVAYALTLHILMNASLTAIGFVLAARLGLSWGDLAPWKPAPQPPRSEDLTGPGKRH